MSKPEWGVKRQCHSCGGRFYDLTRQPIVCPKCSTTLDPDSLLKKRRGRPPAADPKVVIEKPAIVEEIDLDDSLEILGETDDVLEDTSDFGEDAEMVGIETPSEEE